MEINHLTDPIDVYSEWIDETERLNSQIDEENVQGDEDEADEAAEDALYNTEIERRHNRRKYDEDAEHDEEQQSEHEEPEDLHN